MANIIYAEDDPGMREMVTDMLAAAGHSVRTFADGTTALTQIRSDPPDLVLLDYRMGTPDGFEVCRRIKNDPGLEHLPVLMLTAENDVEDRIEGFEAGANDYLPKPFDARELLARVRALLRLSEQGRELNPTTGLPGASAIEREFERRCAAGSTFTLCYLDLDYFKPFNDRFGFPAANAIIESIGRSLRRMVTGTEHFAAHIGGDDFVLMCSRDLARGMVGRAQEELREAVARAVPDEVSAKGSYPGKLRNGEAADVPLTRLSAALLHVTPNTERRLAELGEIAAAAKDQAKQSASGGMVELEV